MTGTDQHLCERCRGLFAFDELEQVMAAGPYGALCAECHAATREPEVIRQGGESE